MVGASLPADAGPGGLGFILVLDMVEDEEVRDSPFAHRPDMLSSVALSGNVTARTAMGGTCRSRRKQTRPTMVRVFPEPAPAITRFRTSSRTIAFRCASSALRSSTSNFECSVIIRLTY